jgi:hypothetical protein
MNSSGKLCKRYLAEKLVDLWLNSKWQIDLKDIEFAPIKFEVADDLFCWSAEIPGKVLAKAEALTGPMTPSGKRVQTINPPGSEVGPGTTATWRKAIADEVNNAMGFKSGWNGR